MAEIANAFHIAAGMIVAGFAGAVIVAGLWALTRRQSEDNYRSPTIRPNVLRKIL